MVERKAGKRRRLVQPPSPTGTNAYLAYLHALVPEIKIESADFARFDATYRIRNFVALFRSPNVQLGNLHQHADELAWFAKRFRDYLKNSLTLDEAFGLKGSRKGRGSAKEKLRLQDREIQARAMFGRLRKQGRLVKQAVGDVAAMLKCTESQAHSLIYRIRSTVRKS